MASEFIAGLQRLFGVEPEQRHQQERFDKSKRTLDERNDELDALLADFKKINTRVTARSRAAPPPSGPPPIPADAVSKEAAG